MFTHDIVLRGGSTYINVVYYTNRLIYFKYSIIILSFIKNIDLIYMHQKRIKYKYELTKI